MKTVFYKHIELDAELEELRSIFEKNNIYYEVSSPETIIDKSIVGSGMFAKYTLKLLPKDFNKANKLIRNSLESMGLNIEDFKHLEDLDNNELLEIIENPRDWSVEAEIVARKILEKRGIKINEQAIINKRENKKLEFQNGKSVSGMIQFLYFIAIVLGFYLSVAFIIAGIGMGYYYAYGTRVDEEGNKFFVYNEKARTNGKFIFYIGILSFFIQMYLLFKIDIF
ncbi:MAG: hypothetical protein AAGA77_14470 [Bacteroidota bacterium]